MADIPFPMTWGTIKGSFGAITADSSDAGLVPDLETVQGSVTITPRIPLVKIYDPEDPMIAIAKVIQCRIIEGKLIGPDGMAEVRVVASDSPGIEPTPLQYDVRMTITGATQQPAPITIDVPTGGVVDLALVVPANPTVPVVTVVSEETKLAAMIAAQEAKDAAINASNSNSAANSARIEAVDAKNSATTSASEALASRNTAVSSAQDAFASMLNSQNAASASIQAQIIAEQARDEAVEAAAGGGGGGFTDQAVADYVIDPSSKTNGAISSIFSKKGVYFIDIRDLGAKTDIDNTAVIQAALDTAPGIPVLIPTGGTYTCSGALRLPSKTQLEIQAGAVLKSTLANGNFLNADGVEGPSLPISGTTVAGMRTLTVPNHGFVPGDYVKVGSGRLYDASSTGSSIGEILRVDSIDGDAVTMTTPLVGGPYQFGDGRSINKFTPAEDIQITGPGVIEGSKTAQSNQIGIRMRFAVRIKISNVYFKNFDQRHTVFRDCAEGIIDKCTFEWAVHTSQAYAVSLADATQDFLITNSTFFNIRHSLSTNNSAASIGRGIPRRIRFSYNTVNWSSTALGGSMGGGDAIDTHTAAEDIWIENNIVNGSSGQGINLECTSGRVVDNYIYNTTGNGIYIHNESDTNGRIIVSGNVVRNPGGHGIVFSSAIRGATTFYDYAEIINNTVEGVTGTSSAFQIGNTTATVDRNVIFTGNSAVNCVGANIFLIRGMSGLVYADNSFQNSTGAISITDTGRSQNYGTISLVGTSLPISLQYEMVGISPGSGSTTGTLASISAGRMGQTVSLRTQSVNSVITINNSGNIRFSSGSSFTLTGSIILVLMYNGTNWIEVSRSAT